MSSEKQARLKQWLATGEARLQPLTFPQRELWECSPVPPGDPSNHICCVIPVRGLLTPRDSIASLQRVVDRQEGLRVSILPGKEKPLQMIRSSGEANLTFLEVPAAQDHPDGVEEMAQEIFRQPFDMVQGPLYRAVALRRGADDHVLVLSIHHAIADGWTLGVFVQDLFGSYMHGLMGLTEPLPAVPLTYSAWGAAERAFWQPAELEKRAAYWKGKLEGLRRLWPTLLPAQGAPRRWVSQIPAALSTQARETARRHGATLFSTLLTAFQAALSRWLGEEDIVVGSPVANRHRQECHETMGYFAGIVPLRGQVDRTRTFAASLQTMHHEVTDAFAHAMPFAELARAVGENAAPGHNPIFQVRFALQNHPVPDVTLPNISARLRMRSTGTARFDLACEITEEGDTFEVAWPYRPERFSEEQIQEFDGLFQAVLAAACRSPESSIGALLP